MTLRSPRSASFLPRLLLALIALALVLRLGGGCAAMATMPTTPAAHASRCGDMPAGPGKHERAETCACAACLAVSEPARTRASGFVIRSESPVAAPLPGLTNLSAGPPPPPPRIA